MAINFKERTFYLKMGWDDKAKKKTTFYGGSWGSMDKREANASAIKTGDGLVVVDVDTLNLKEIDKGLRKELEKLEMTVATKRGGHWYFKDDNSSQFVNKAGYSKLVDVRSDGGIIFNQYKGNSDQISYKRVGKVHKKMPKTLRALLIKMMRVSKKKVKNRTQWEKIPRGEIHDGVISYIMRDVNSGLDYDAIIANGIDYVQKHLGGTQREIDLMMERIKWGYEKRLENKLETAEVKQLEPLEIGGEFEDSEVLTMLVKAQKGGALELERVMKEIKKKLKISVGTMKAMLKDSPVESEGLSVHFKGEVIFDSALGVFAEVRDRYVVYYNRSVFVQTVISKSGWCTASDVNEQMHTVPHKYIVYNPTEPTGDIFTKHGDEAINVFRPIDFGEGRVKKIPKTINKILDNLFSEQPDAKEDYINWLATIVQTGMRTGVAWGFFGASGSGKGFMADLMQMLVGIENSSLNVSDTDLQSTFNPYAHHKQFVHLNEVASDFHGRHGVAGKLKALISDPYIRVNQKNMPEITIDNYVNVMLNSNKPNPIEIDMDDRRWNMIVTNTPLTECKWWKGNTSYQKAKSQAFEFGRYLMQYEVDMDRATRPMAMSVAKASIIEQTTSTLQVVGHAIKKGDAESIKVMLDIDDDDYVFSEDEIEYSCDSGKWSNKMLNDIYVWATGKRELKGQEVKKYFVNPFIGVKPAVWKQNGKTVRGVIV